MSADLSSSTASSAAFNDIIHSPTRLRICGLLRPVDALSFVVLRDTLDLTSATLSKNLKVLVEVGYLTMDKAASRERVDLRRVAWVRLTPLGRDAFDSHLAALQAITRTPGLARDPGATEPPRPGVDGSPAAAAAWAGNT